jgi:uncharacterized membrane protein YkvA (DUF1232 family)
MRKLTRLLTVLRKGCCWHGACCAIPRAPKGAKLATVLAIVYVLSPIDLIPDTIPLLGWLDDGLLAYVLLQPSSSCRPSCTRRCVPRWTPAPRAEPTFPPWCR